MMSVKRFELNEAPFTLLEAGAVMKKALLACEEAYQPYSKFSVGCAILSGDGSVVSGCNVETANYDGSHAEENALGAMVVSGRRDPVLVACVARHETEKDFRSVMSCGKCRQALHEFSSLNGTELWMVFKKETEVGMAFIKLSDLLIEPFGPADIGIDLAKYRR